MNFQTAFALSSPNGMIGHENVPCGNDALSRSAQESPPREEPRSAVTEMASFMTRLKKIEMLKMLERGLLRPFPTEFNPAIITTLAARHRYPIPNWLCSKAVTDRLKLTVRELRQNDDFFLAYPKMCDLLAVLESRNKQIEMDSWRDEMDG